MFAVNWVVERTPRAGAWGWAMLYRLDAAGRVGARGEARVSGGPWSRRFGDAAWHLGDPQRSGILIPIDSRWGCSARRGRRSASIHLRHRNNVDTILSEDYPATPTLYEVSLRLFVAFR